MRTIIFEAIEVNNIKIVQECIDLKINIDEQYNYWWDTPLIFASEKGHTEIIELLIKHSDVNKTNVLSRSTLMNASEKGYTKIVGLLIKSGADMNKMEYYGMTPLMFASKNGHLEIVKQLLNNGADTTIVGDYKLTPQLGFNGARVIPYNCNNKTALQIAIKYDHSAIVELLKNHEQNSKQINLDYTTFMDKKFAKIDQLVKELTLLNKLGSINDDKNKEIKDKKFKEKISKILEQ